LAAWSRLPKRRTIARPRNGVATDAQAMRHGAVIADGPTRIARPVPSPDDTHPYQRHFQQPPRTEPMMITSDATPAAAGHDSQDIASSSPTVVAAQDIQDGLAALHDAVVMMVDDDSVLIEVLQSSLEEEGYHDFVATTNPLKAVELVREARPDVLFLDMVMPRMSGLEVLQQLRNDQVLCHTPVIVLTASSDRKIKLDALKLGAADFLSKPVDPSELSLRLRNTLAAKAYRDRLTYLDPLTELPNRRTFLDRLDWACKHAQRYRKRGMLLHIDVDRFKQVNDALGPAAGDRILKAFGERLGTSIRASDSIARLGRGGAVPSLSRLGGDEFSLLLPDMDTAESAAMVAHRLLDAMQTEPFHSDGREVFLTASIGITVFPDDGEHVDNVLKNAGAALREAKDDGGNQYRFYSRAMNDQAMRRLSVESELRRAIERDELRLHFQPKVDSATQQPAGAEVLVRWQHPERGLIGPGEFIPIAESSGLIVPLGEWIFAAACRQAAAWRAAGLNPVPLSINVSPLQFREPCFFAGVERMMRETGLGPEMLCIELTETVILDQTARTSDALGQLRALGIKLSIDDFGAGFTSLSYLKRLPFGELKIDKSFIDDIETDADSAAIVSAVIALAHSLGLRVVAEGVETHAQHTFLKAKACDECQGYLFSRPLHADAYVAWLKQARESRPALRAVG